MTLRQRDIALVPVPFTDLSANKRRPVAVLSTTSHNRKSEEEVVAAVASNTAAPGRPVAISSSDLAEGTLRPDSVVRADKLHTLSQRIVVRRYGRLTESAFQQVLGRLDQLLGRTR